MQESPRIFLPTGTGNDPLAELRQACRATLARPLPIAPITNVAAVGAFFDADGTALCSRDLFHVAEAFRLCASHGIPPSEDFRLAVLNLVYGNDFLLLPETAKFDLIITCLVFNPLPGRPLPNNDPRLYLTSPCHHAPGAWHDAAVKSQARFVMAIGGRHEINRRHFLSPVGGTPSAYSNIAYEYFPDDGGEQCLMGRHDIVRQHLAHVLPRQFNPR